MTARRAAESPGPAVAAAFERIRCERMRDLPFLNAALRVEAVGFRIVEDAWVGVVVTPWSMNLLSISVRDGAGHNLPAGTVVPRRFPSGVYDFVSGCTEGIGAHLACSLFSPVLEFETQADALAVAEFALEQLLDTGDRSEGSTDAPSPSPPDRAPPARTDRRAFLGLTRRAGT